jgi:hypothetical protein
VSVARQKLLAGLLKNRRSHTKFLSSHRAALAFGLHKSGAHMNIHKLIAPLLLAIVLLGCGKPVPPEKSAYVGEWQATTMYLLITQDGSVRYKRLKGGASTSVEGPLKAFDGDNFEVGVGPISTTFIVNRAPFQDSEQWKMVVDGVELSKNAQ